MSKILIDKVRWPFYYFRHIRDHYLKISIILRDLLNMPILSICQMSKTYWKAHFSLIMRNVYIATLALFNDNAPHGFVYGKMWRKSVLLETRFCSCLQHARLLIQIKC